MLRLEALRVAVDEFTVTADFGIEQGERVAVIGPSGAGKSTLLGAIAGFMPVVSGRILWKGDDIGGLPPGKRPVSILFQDQNLFPHLSIAQNVGLGLDPGLRLTATQRGQVTAALGQVGLAGLEACRPSELSGGQQSRVALARVLLRARPILLLDEPFAALGPALKAEMLDLVAEIVTETGATLLMVSHDPQDARRVAGQTVVVDAGVAMPPQPTEALFTNPPEVLARYLGV
jgi:thiamine transport system ATP-binding protein